MQGSISVNRIRTLLASAVVSTLLAGPVIGVMAQDATPAADNSDI